MNKSPLQLRDLNAYRRIRHTFANVAASTSLQTLVAAPTDGTRIAVLGIVTVCGATETTMTLYSASTAISSLIANGANSGLAVQPGPMPLWVCEPGQPLRVTTGSGSATGINLIYACISG